MRNVGAVIFLLACGGGGADDDKAGPTDVADADADADSDADADQDGDGYIPPGDCDDDDALVYPGAEDPLYDGVDSDCAGDSDFDGDRDGEDSDEHGGVDCDDADPIVNTGGTERCNGADDDCDGEIDEDADDATNYWTDLDEDGHGDPALLVPSCAPPPGAAEVGDDCDDADPTVYPAAPDVPCDGRDNDCNDVTTEPGLVTLDGAPVADLDAALAGAGATIELCEGAYAVTGLVVTRGLTIRGLGGSAITTLDAGGTTPVLTISTDQPVALEGMTLTGGLGRVSGPDVHGGGLYVDDGASIEAADLVITGNRAGLGGGVYAGLGVTLALTDSLVTGNEADPALATVSTGGGVFAGEDARVTLTTSWISANTAGQCGGASFDRGAVVTGDGASGFDGNSALSLAGGGVCLRSGGALADVDVTNNASADAGGGIDGQDLTLDGVTVRANTAALEGAGMSVNGAVELASCTVADNVTDLDGGGLRAALPGTSVTVLDSVVTGNEALSPLAIGGGALLSADAGLTSVNTDWGAGVTDNTPADVGLSSTGATYAWAGIASFVCADGVVGSCL